ncbi:hypothetical protein FACS18945_1940 [Bacteroidia bacterium]|nr:hypothetical protein FACS18945_1940 [Bacteroidia bacterium]
MIIFAERKITMQTPELKEYISKRRNLFWYTPESKIYDISDSFLVETILNYGTMADVRELLKIMGIKNVAKIFFDSINQSDRRKNNYMELPLNYFTLLFNRYAH